MSLFKTDTHKKMVTYGGAETAALQPGLFDAWRRMMATGGVPYAGNINDMINEGYARAQAELGRAGFGQDVISGVQGDMSRRGTVAGNLLKAGVGLQGQENMLTGAGQQAAYLGALTSQRPGFAFDESTPWSSAMKGIKTLAEPAAIAMAVLQGNPAGLGVGAGNTASPVQNMNDPYNPNNFRLTF